MIIVTGSAGFIGFHLSQRLLSEGYDVVGIDNLNNFYDVQLKKDRIKELQKNKKFTFVHKDILDMDKKDMKDAEYVFHEAAYAGVRNSVENPLLYDDVNVHGTVKLLKLSADTGVKKFMFASSSSVYGDLNKFPTPETYDTNPLSPYGVSKLAAEKYCNAFYKCYGLPTISFRYFTVYGPWGRPDMLMMLTIASCFNGAPVTMFKKDGKMVDFSRDFSYVDDVVQANFLAMKSNIKNDVFNLSAKHEVSVKYVFDFIQKEIGKKANFTVADPSPADPLKTLGDISKIRKALKFEPKVDIEEGIRNTIKWYKQYNKIK
jgi:UDP-glucose 4-epimerase